MSNSKKEDPTVKKKYVFFSDPDIIGQRVEASAAIAQSQQGHKAEQPKKHPIAQCDEKFLLYSVQDCPFPFIGAVKRKLALHDSLDAHKKTHEAACEENEQQFKITEDQYRTIYNMDFVHSLKVPELSIRESSGPKSFHDKTDKPVKSSEKVQRKLDFSMSDSSSIVNSEGIEPLKVPNLSIASNLAKKKEHTRESSREKENRSKRIRKDDVCFTKHDDMLLDYSGRTWSQKRVPRKELSDNSSDTPFIKLKNERLPFRVPKEADATAAKSKTKNFTTSISKKDSEKRQRPVASKLGKTSRDNSLETKSKNSSNESVAVSVSVSERSAKIPDTITTRDSYNKTVFDIVEYRYKDDCHGMKQIDEQKHPGMFDSRQIKQRKLVGQLQGKKAVEKIKSTSKGEVKHFITNTDESDNIENTIESNPVLLPRNSSVVTSSNQQTVQQMKQKDNCNNIMKSSRSNEESICANDSLQQYGSRNTNKDDEQSSSQSVMTEETSTKHESNNDSEHFSSENVFSEALLDPRRISFRDECRSPQDEFHDLVTPNMNLILRSKRRKQFTQNDADLGTNKNEESKYNLGTKTEEEEDTIQLFHPAALHKQFQAELQLLDSVNESFRKMINVENSLYSVEHHQKKKLVSEDRLDEESNLVYSMVASDKGELDADAIPHATNNAPPHAGHFVSGEISVAEFENSLKKANSLNKSKPVVKAVEVQTQTVNDIATQTDTRFSRHTRNAQIKCLDICGATCEHGFARNTEAAQVSLDSFGQFEDLDQIEEISLPSRLRAMSEISLHETTSSIKTETGTEISISTRDVTCSFNKYLNLEIAQLIKDEKQRYDKIEMLFKSREKTLNDRTKKLVKLEEQKRALRDTGQDSRISSVKKKQRALLLKLQQEKDEMNRLKELHKIASQERKLMLQKQRNMFNPHMSTKNILTKLKRSADSSSPRRLSGPMKGYDIRSNSSMSSLVDSDKSQHDRSQVDARLQISENDLHFSRLDPEESIVSFAALNKSYETLQSSELNEKLAYKSPREENRSKYDVKSKKFEEKMPKADDSRLKSRQFDVEPKLISDCSLNISSQYMLDKEQNSDVPEILQSFGKSISEQLKSESDTLVEELSKRSKSSQAVESYFQNLVSSREKTATTNTETIPEEISSFHQDTKTSKSSQVSEDILQSLSKSSRKSNKSITTDKDASKKVPASFETKSSSKRKSSKCQKTKSSSSILTENILRSKSNSEKISQELINHHNKRTKVEKEIVESDNIGEDARSDDVKFKGSSFQALFQHSIIDRDNNSESLPESENNDESKENVHQRILDRNLRVYRHFPEGLKKNTHHLDNATPKSRISTFAVSRHSSEESERNYSKSVVVRSQDHDMKASKKLEQIFNAREAALATRRSYAEEWMAWHAKLSAEEDRVARMEQAVVKLMSATSNVFSHQDTTISSDTSDVEGRIELLTEKLAERRMEMSRLKREARKQTKQKLRAVEANLLHQIKRYDTTIHEMKKKLESKKGFDKDIDRSSVEFKLLADFKVPEIPLKKIQDLYKNNDLLRSRSESDLFSTRRQLKNGSSTDYPSGSVIVENKCTESRSKGKSAKSGHFERMQVSEHLSYTRMNSHCSNQSILDGSISERIEYSKRDRASTSAISEEILTEKRTYSSNELYATERSKQASSIETDESAGSLHTSGTGDIKTEISTARSASDGSIVSTEKVSNTTSKLRSEAGGHQSIKESFSMKASSMRTASSQPVVATDRYDTEYSQTFTELSDNYSQDLQIEMKRIGSGSDAFNYRKSIDSLNMNHESLDKNISSLENELKTLEEMVSCLGKKPNEKFKLASDETEKSLTEDVSEICTRSSNESQCTANDSHSENGSLKIEDASDHNKRAISMQHSVSDDDTRKPSTVALENDLLEYVGNANSNPDAIDYKARSNEILNEIEKSIISEHIKSTGQDKSETGLKSTTTIQEILTHSGVASQATYTEEAVDFVYKHEPVDVNEKVCQEDNKSLADYKDLSPVANDESVQEASKIIEVSKIEPSALLSNSTGSSEEIPTKTDGVSSASEASDAENIYKQVESNCSKQRSFPSHVTVTGDDQNWTTSDSFNIQQNPADSEVAHMQIYETATMGHDTNIVGSCNETDHLDDSNLQNFDAHLASDIDASMFLPKGESTNIDISRIKLDDTASDSVGMKSTNAAKDILDFGVSIRKQEEWDHDESSSNTEDFQQAIRESVTEILDRVERSLENYTTPETTGVYLGIEEDKCENLLNKQDFTKFPITEATFEVERQIEEESGREPVTEEYITLNEDNAKSLTEEIESSERSATPIVNITLHLQVDSDKDTLSSDEKKPKDIVITELLDPGSVERDILPELVIDAKLELAEEVLVGAEDIAREDTEAKERHEAKDRKIEIEANVENVLESVNEQDSSDGEQRDNLVEIAESELHTIEKQIEKSSISHPEDQATLTSSKIEELKKDQVSNESTEVAIKSQDADKPQEKLDSLSSTPVATTNKTFDIIKDPEYEDISEESLEVSEILEKRCQDKYESVQKSDQVLRILDEITQKSAAVLEESSRKKPSNLDPQIFPHPVEQPKPETEIYVPPPHGSGGEHVVEEVANDECLAVKEELASANALEAEDSLKAQNKLAETSTNSEESYGLQRDIFEKQEQDVSSDSSEGCDTPRGVPDIEIDSPTDSNDIRLDVDTLNDDSARKNIVAMINELKASMEQPGLEVAELEAKVLRIKELQIELEIKALEAKQVPYYVREIPNKPPPPYTPPSGGVRILPSLESFSPPPPVVPSNVEELTAFTDKATAIIYKAKLAGEEIMFVEPPPEIYDLTNDANEVFKRDKRIYNTFLFDLCKEIIADVYQSEYEKPGPSWTKPNVKTKPIIRLPKTVEELNEHVSQEVATLFGFKTKLQRENMVMRWSRKRRDRVDELLAREAQAEEAQWTKFHDDELTLKNHVTVAILDTLILETVKEVKVAYAKKRKIMI